MVIRVEHLTKVIQDNRVIEDVSLFMESGKIYGLKGYNGSGKTMLMRLVCGLVKPTEGQIWINNKQLGKNIDFPECTGILIENPAFLNYYTGFRNLKILAELKGGITQKEIDSVLERVGLDPQDKRKYGKYSLGMKQRLGIAAAIMGSPDLLILDEPFNALDESGIEILKQILKEERERGALILLSCHNDEYLNELVDTRFVIEHGRIAECGGEK